MTRDIPVALLLGGTSGIGAAIARALCKALGGCVHIILVGRNLEGAQAVISSLYLREDEGAKAEFLYCDASRMQNIHDLAKVLQEKGLTSLTWLVLSPGCLSTQAWEETAEGIDRQMALAYYSRFLLTTLLLPLLRSAKSSGQEARVLSVCAPGTKQKVDLDDLGMKNASKRWKGTFGWLRKEKEAGVAYNDLMVDTFAEENPEISFIHVYPGLVRTAITHHLPAIPRFIFGLLFTAFGSNADTVGTRLARLLLAPEFSKGAWFRGPGGEDVGRNEWSTEEARMALKMHSEKVAGLV